MDEGRFGFPRNELRSRTARGAIVNGVFLLLVEALAAGQAIVVARILDASQVGLYGIASVTAMTLLSLKQIGLDEAFVQQEESDEEVAFQQAFTLDLLLSAAFCLITACLAPVVASIYSDASIAGLMLALSATPLLFALQAPAWVFLRRMDFIRQRTLQAVAPLVGVLTTVSLLAAGLGAWALVLGSLAGNSAAAVTAVVLSPYRLRFNLDREMASHYLRFSAPIALASVCGLIIEQGQLFAFDLKAGVVGVGYLTVAVTMSRYANRADQLMTQTIYPAICAVRNSPSRLREAFEKSNRLTAMWALPFGASCALFAAPFVHWVIGTKWEPAVGLIQLVGVSTAIYQLGFNWTAFHRAVGRTRPQSVYAIAGLITFVAVPIPLLFVVGPIGFGWGLLAVNAIAGALRWLYMRRLIEGLHLASLLFRSLSPAILAAAAIFAWQMVQPPTSSAIIFALQFLTFVVVFALITLKAEGPLIREAIGIVRTRNQPEVQVD